MIPRRDFFKKAAVGIAAMVAAPLLPGIAAKPHSIPGPWVLVKFTRETPVVDEIGNVMTCYHFAIEYRGDLDRKAILDHPVIAMLRRNGPYERQRFAIDPFGKTLTGDFWKKA